MACQACRMRVVRWRDGDLHIHLFKALLRSAVETVVRHRHKPMLGTTLQYYPVQQAVAGHGSESSG